MIAEPQSAPQSQLVCLRYSGSIGILLEKLRLEEFEDRHKKERDEEKHYIAQYTVDQITNHESTTMEEKHEALYQIAHGQNFESLRPQWPWLSQGLNCSIKICTFVEPSVAEELELALIHAILQGTRLRLRCGDVIVSRVYLDLVKNVISMRSGNTPRGNRPRLKGRIEVPRLETTRYDDIEKLRPDASEALRGQETVDSCGSSAMPNSKATIQRRSAFQGPENVLAVPEVNLSLIHISEPTRPY